MSLKAKVLVPALSCIVLFSCHSAPNSEPSRKDEHAAASEPRRSVRIALEELEYHDEMFRESAAARLIEMNPDASPFVKEALSRAKASGKDLLAARCERILEGMEAYRSFSDFVAEEVEPGDERRTYPDPPKVRTDLAPERLVEGTFLFGIEGRLRFGPVGPPPLIVRIFAVQGRDGHRLELKGWKALAGILKPATGDLQIRETSLLVIKMSASVTCPCVDPGDVRVDNWSILATPLGTEVKARAVIPNEGSLELGHRSECLFELKYDADGRISNVRYSVKRHHHL